MNTEKIRKINVEEITAAVAELCIKANKILPDGVKKSLEISEKVETNPLAKSIFCDLLNNLESAKRLNIPICQDTGMAVVFLDIGQDVHFVGGDLYKAVNDGVSKGYVEGLLRLSIVKDPLRRENTNNNTPAVIHTKIVSGDKVKITIAPKGFGSENMSRIKMFTPSASEDNITDFIAETVKIAGGNPCPPVIVGVGLGGNFEHSAELAKMALLRSPLEDNIDEFYAKMEQNTLKKINATGVGSQGFGGDITALGVNIIAAPTHIAGLPCAVNISCHVTRHAEAVV